MTFSCTDAFVTIAEPNIEKLVWFYTQFLGKKPEHYIPTVYAEFQLPGLKLGIFKPKKQHESKFKSSGKNSISLCLEVSNLEDVLAHLTALGYPPVGEILTADHGREIYVYDPSGNRLILHHQHYGPDSDMNFAVKEHNS